MTTFSELNIEELFPDSDGKPMADNTEQFRWIVLIKENLEILFAEDPDVFVAGDLLWYPEKSQLIGPVAPDVMVVFGRPKGRRGSYRQWQEDNIGPQVVFEILSPSNTPAEMLRKLEFYEHYGVEEYYQYDPDELDLCGWYRDQGVLIPIQSIDGWVSPRLGVRFEWKLETFCLYRPDGEPFLSSVEADRLRTQERQRAEQERQRAEQERQRADAAQAQAEMYAKKLRELGIDLQNLP